MILVIEGHDHFPLLFDLPIVTGLVKLIKFAQGIDDSLVKYRGAVDDTDHRLS
jgi:hypothetical protein